MLNLRNQWKMENGTVKWDAEDILLQQTAEMIYFLPRVFLVKLKGLRTFCWSQKKFYILLLQFLSIIRAFVGILSNGNRNIKAFLSKNRYQKYPKVYRINSFSRLYYLRIWLIVRKICIFLSFFINKGVENSRWKPHVVNLLKSWYFKSASISAGLSRVI